MMTLLALAAAPYFFESSFSQAISGAKQQLIPAVQGVAGGILTLTFLLGVYEAFFRQGSVRDLGVSLLKYVAAAILVAYWIPIFQDITTNGFTQVAHQLDTYSISDIYTNWRDQIQQFWNDNSPGVWQYLAAPGAGLSGVFSLLLTVLGYLFYAVAMLLFTVIYDFWGCVLYVLGPLLIALMPSLSLGSYAKNYLTKLAEWACWPILFSLFGYLMVVINNNNVSTVVAGQTFSDVIQSSTNVILIGVMSMLYGICLLLIPFIAHSLIHGEFLGVGAAVLAMSMKAARVVAGDASALASSSGGDGAIGGAGGGTRSSDGGGSGGAVIPSTPPPHSEALSAETSSVPVASAAAFE